jgi:HD-GYP domain-containing protein (c-di-GMP phosphodiesterase class II)
MGEQIVETVNFLREMGPFIRHHHERFDGQGYPDGLSGENIPPEARIIFIGEVFDSLTSDTSYHSTMELKEALGEMERGAGTQFDPEILRIFLDNISRNPSPTA